MGKLEKQAATLEEKLEELNGIVEQTFYYQQKVYEWNKRIEENKQYIKDSLGKRKELTVKPDSNLEFKVTRTVETKVDFFRDQLLVKMEKDIYERMVDKTIKIKNEKELIKLLKSHGVSPKRFKEYIIKEETLNKSKIDNLIESNQISIEDLHGCYSAEFNETINIKKTK